MALISSDQIRAARALIRISAAELAQRAGLGLATIKRLEAGSGVPASNVRSLEAIQRSLETLGIEFIGTPDDRPGVRLASPRKEGSSR